MAAASGLPSQVVGGGERIPVSAPGAGIGRTPNSSKRSIRWSKAFAEAFKAEKLLAQRTKRLPGLIRDELKALDVDEDTIEAIVTRVPEIGSESDRERGRAQEDKEGPLENRQLIFVGHNELRPLAEKLLTLYQDQGKQKWDKMKIGDITKALRASLPRSVDIAMFGRMTTSDAFEDIQAAVQVAHALSVNALAQEFDYFTAVDDISGESGAGMIGDVEYNSSTYYKYYNIHWEQLCENLGGDTEVARRAVLAFLDGSRLLGGGSDRRLMVKVKMRDLRQYSAGSLSREAAVKRVTVTER